jgi:hypothetical protein
MEDLNVVLFFLYIAGASALMICSVLPMRTGAKKAFSVQLRLRLRRSTKDRALAAAGALRNKLGYTHSVGPKRVSPGARHAELAVDLSGTMAMFLIATWNTKNAKTRAKIFSRHAPLCCERTKSFPPKSHSHQIGKFRFVADLRCNGHQGRLCDENSEAILSVSRTGHSLRHRKTVQWAPSRHSPQVGRRSALGGKRTDAGAAPRLQSRVAAVIRSLRSVLRLGLARGARKEGLEAGTPYPHSFRSLAGSAALPPGRLVPTPPHGCWTGVSCPNCADLMWRERVRTLGAPLTWRAP